MIQAVPRIEKSLLLQLGQGKTIELCPCSSASFAAYFDKFCGDEIAISVYFLVIKTSLWVVDRRLRIILIILAYLKSLKVVQTTAQFRRNSIWQREYYWKIHSGCR